MDIPDHSIQPLLESDLHTLASFIFASNLSQPTNQFLFLNWPNETAQISLYLSGVQSTFADPCTEMFKVINNKTLEIVATLILTRKTPTVNNTAPPPSKEKQVAPPGVNAEFLALVRKTLADVLKEMEATDHFVLSSIFVKAEFRSKGLGKRLVRLCLQRASTASVPLFLSSVPSAYDFYKKLGFLDTTHGDIDLSKWGPEKGGYGVYRLQGMVIFP